MVSIHASRQVGRIVVSYEVQVISDVVVFFTNMHRQNLTSRVEPFVIIILALLSARLFLVFIIIVVNRFCPVDYCVVVGDDDQE